MAIHFEQQKWNMIESVYTKWWEHRLERPVIPIALSGADPKRAMPDVPPTTNLNQGPVWDLSYSAKQIVDRFDYDLSCQEFMGDGFPHADYYNFGPCITAAFLGAEPCVTDGRVWFQPKEVKELKDIHFEYDPNNVWYQRIRDIYQFSVDLWGDTVVPGMVDLGGTLDILAIFRGSNNLLLDLYEEPEEVLRLVKEIDTLYLRYFDELNRIFEDVAPGYTDWSNLYANKRSYTLQSDLTFMISNDMFRQFALSSLVRASKEIPYTMYHLDGSGELTHLDDFVSIPTINAIQWVPGAGAKPEEEWPEVYQKIHDAGKGIQVFMGFQSIDAISKQLGTSKGINAWGIYGCTKDGEWVQPTVENREIFSEKLKEYGIYES